MSADAAAGAPDMRDLIRVVFKRLWVVPVVTVLCFAAGIMTLEFLTPKYESRVRLLAVGTPRVESAFYNQLPTRGDAGVAATVAEGVKSRDVLREVVLSLKLHKRDETQYDSDTRRSVMKAKDDLIASLKGAKKWVLEDLLKREPEAEDPAPDPVQVTVEALEENVTVEAVEKTDLVVVTVLDPDADTASRIGNAIAYAYILFNLKQQAAETAQKYGPEHPVTRQINDSIGRVRYRLANPVANRDGDFGAGSVKIVEHAYPSTEPKKPKKDYVLFGSLAGGFAGSFLIIFLLDLVDPTFRGPEDFRRVLGRGVPMLGSISRKAWRKSGKNGEAFPPDVSPVANHLESVLKARPSARKIFFAVADRSRAGGLLVRALSRCFGPKAAPAMDFPSDAAKCRAMLDEASKGHDYVLIAGPAYSHRADFLFLSSLCDATVVIVNERETRRKAVASMLHALELNGSVVVGAVLNNQRHPLPGFLYRAV